MEIEDNKSKKCVLVSIELSFDLSIKDFDELYEKEKPKYELALMKKKESIAQIQEFVNDICKAFQIGRA